ncbi:MAG: hypothetical protein ACREN3_09600 [Gemmatimonadaceae bacterium]
MRLSVLLLVAASVTACSGSGECPFTATCAELRSAADSTAGSWTEIQTWQGISLQLTLSARDTSLFGSATYRAIGGPGGTARVAGYVFWQGAVNTPAGFVMPAQPEVVLNFAFDNGTSAHFDQGVLQTPGTLSGVLTFSDSESNSYGTSFARAGP